MNHFSILYRTPKGLAAQVGGLPVFPSRGFNDRLQEGVVELLEGTLYRKTGYAFADMRNVVGVLPASYRTLDFHLGFGVPQRVWKGVLGGSLVIKEWRPKGHCLKVYGLDGSILVHEKEFKDQGRLNFHFSRLDAAVGVWNEITDSVVPVIMESIKELNFDIDVSDPSLVDLCMRVSRNSVLIHTDGYVFLNGKHETMLFWSVRGQIFCCWLGQKMDWQGQRIQLGGVSCGDGRGEREA